MSTSELASAGVGRAPIDEGVEEEHEDPPEADDVGDDELVVEAVDEYVDVDDSGENKGLIGVDVEVTAGKNIWYLNVDIIIIQDKAEEYLLNDYIKIM